MNQKEYELIAGVIKYTKPSELTDDAPDSYNAGWKDGAQRQHTYVLNAITETLEKNYSNFDKNKFLTACGLEPVDNAN